MIIQNTLLFDHISNILTTLKKKFGILNKSLRMMNSNPSCKIFARLYGYKNVNGVPEQVVNEFAVIVFVHALMLNTSIAEIKTKLDERGYRNRSGNKFCFSEIKGLVKPIYAGFVELPCGLLIRSKYYHEIISLKNYRLNKKSSELTGALE